MDNFLAKLRKPKTRQVPLFDFKPSDKLRHSGFTPEEERELIGFCLSDNYPRTHTVERTGTRYSLKGPEGARRLLAALRFGSAAHRKEIVTTKEQMRLAEQR